MPGACLPPPVPEAASHHVTILAEVPQGGSGMVLEAVLESQVSHKLLMLCKQCGQSSGFSDVNVNLNPTPFNTLPSKLGF